MRWTAGLLFLLLTAACSRGGAAPPFPTADPAYIAPGFEAIALDGTTYRLNDLRGQWVILNFWATWCEPCVREMPALQAIADRYAQDGVVLLGLNMAESEPLVREFVAQHDITFPVLINVTSETRQAYQAISLPQTILIAPNGEIMWRQFGPVDEHEFSDVLAGFIAGEA
jgi:peroxiredoxin